MDKSIKKGRKNPDYYENFFDNYLLDIVDIVKPYFHKLGFTPNLITIIGFVFGLFSVYLLYTNHFFFPCKIKFAYKILPVSKTF